MIQWSRRVVQNFSFMCSIQGTAIATTDLIRIKAGKLAQTPPLRLPPSFFVTTKNNSNKLGETVGPQDRI